MPKVVNHEERRELIASAAARAIAELGMDHVTTADLASAAGCTVGALPRYFRNKDEILIAALRYVLENVRIRAAKRAVAKGTLDPLLVWDAILPVNAEQRREWRVWIAFSGRATHNEVLRDEFRKRYEQGQHDTRLLLHTMQQQDAFNGPLDLDAATELLNSVVDGLGVRATLEARQWPAARQREHLARALRLLGWRG